METNFIIIIIIFLCESCKIKENSMGSSSTWPRRISMAVFVPSGSINTSGFMWKTVTATRETETLGLQQSNSFHVAVSNDEKK